MTSATSRGTLPLPRCHDDVDRHWLSAALRAGGLDVDIERFTRHPLGEGVGMMAAIELFELHYSSGRGPERVAVKLPAVNPTNLAVAMSFDIYRREVRFYTDIAPSAPEFTPAVLFAESDGVADFALILEDMSDYRLGDQLTGCSADDAELAVVGLGRLHASFWNDVDRPELAFIPWETPSAHGDALRTGVIAVWDSMISSFGDVVPAFMQDARDDFLAALPAMQRWLATPPVTIVHGDFRMDNVFFGLTAGQRPVTAIDWQGILVSKGIRDVAYLISQSMRIDDRRAAERGLVDAWHSTLVERGVADYSAERAWHDYQLGVLAMWAIVVVIAGSLDPTNERGRAWITETIKRSAAAIDDHGLIARIADFTTGADR